MTPSSSAQTVFVRALRRRSRIALYSSLLLTGVTTYLAVDWIDRSSTAQDPNYLWARQDLSQEPSVRLLARYIQIDTSQPDADEMSGALFLAEELRRAGIEPTIEDLGNRKANLWAILEGESPQAIVLHNHIDTDPLGDPATWHHPPLSGLIEGPHIWGRGSFDMKSVAIAQLQAFVDLARSGRKPRQSVIFLATGSEEVGSALGMRRILAQRPELAQRFGVVLTEGGVVEAVDVHSVKYWGTEIAQKRVVTVRYEGLREEIDALVKELVDPYRTIGPLVVPQVRAFLQHYAPTRHTKELRDLLGDLDRLVREPERVDKLPPLLRALFFHEALPVPPPPPDGPNSQLEVRLLLLPGVETYPVVDELIPPILAGNLRRTVEDEVGPRLPPDPTLDPTYLAIQKVLARHKPGAPLGPYVVTRSLSDARFVRTLGIPAYGFSPFHIVTSETMYIGAMNEHFGLEGFIEGVAIYRDLLVELTSDIQRASN